MGAQRIVARNRCREGAFESRLVQVAHELEREGLIERERSFVAQLSRHPDFFLRLGERRLREWLRFDRRRERGGFLRAAENADALECTDAFDEGIADLADVLIRMAGGQEAREAFHDVNAEVTHVGIEQTAQTVFACKADIEPAREGFRPRGDADFFQMGIDALYEALHAGTERFLQRRTSLLEVQKDGFHRCQHHRVAHESAGEEGRRDFGNRRVAELPLAAVERIHVLRVAGEDADRQTAADYLAVSRHVALDAPVALHAGRVHAKAGHDLVDDQGGLVGRGDIAQLLHEFLRPQIGMARLYRLDQDRGDIVDVGLDPFEAFGPGVGQYDHVAHGALRDAGRERESTRNARLAARLDEHFVELAVIVAVEADDLILAGHGAREAHRCHHGFRTGIAEGDALMPGHLGEHLGDFARQRRLRSDGEAFRHLRVHCLHHEIRRMTKRGLTVAVDHVDIFIAVDVPDLRTLGTLGDDRVDEFLPFLAEAAGGTRIGKHRTIGLRTGLGGSCPGRVANRQVGDERRLGTGDLRRAGCAGLVRGEARRPVLLELDLGGGGRRGRCGCLRSHGRRRRCRSLDSHSSRCYRLLDGQRCAL